MVNQEWEERSGQEASVVQRQNYSLPSCRPGFDSRLMHFYQTALRQSALQQSLTLRPAAALCWLFLLGGLIILKMNLKQRMEHQNRNNSSIINNSNFDFAQASKEDQIYEKSRRECEEELVKRKNELEYERANMLKLKEKELNHALEKFNSDFEEIRKQVVNLVNQHLTETKARMIAEIKEKKSVDTYEEVHIKKQVEEMLNIINTNLMGLKQNQYREYIAKIVTSDFDTARDDIKQGIRKMRYPAPLTQVDEKSYSCFRGDLAKMVHLSFNSKTQYTEGIAKDSGGSDFHNINMHQNRDKLKKAF